MFNFPNTKARDSIYNWLAFKIMYMYYSDFKKKSMAYFFKKKSNYLEKCKPNSITFLP